MIFPAPDKPLKISPHRGAPPSFSMTPGLDIKVGALSVPEGLLISAASELFRLVDL